MNRRNFLGLGVGVLAVTMIPANLSAANFRTSHPKLWDATKVESAMQELFGTSSAIEGKVKLKAPDIAENGAVIPVSVSTKLKATKVAIFQDANPESTVAVFSVPKDGIIDYSIRIRLAKTGTITAVAQTADGKLYKSSKLTKVTIGGCGG